jgi:hypothetical protein
LKKLLSLLKIRELENKKAYIQTHSDPIYGLDNEIEAALYLTDSEIESFKKVTIFSELYNEENQFGKIQKFKLARIKGKELAIEKLKFSISPELSDTFEKSTKHFRRQLKIGNQWLHLMAILERYVCQSDCYIDPKLTYRIQEQKSGENKFKYIVIRFPFFDILKGKIELRTYFNKLEDYPAYKSLDALLANNPEYVNNSIREVRKIMELKIKENRISLDTIIEKLLKLESEEDRQSLDDHMNQVQTAMDNKLMREIIKKRL